MSKGKEKKLSRREFMQLAAVAGGTLAIAGGGYIGYKSIRSSMSQEIGLARLNPAFRIKEISDQKIELFTHLTNGELLKYQFEGLEADIFREIGKEKEIDPLIVDLAKKHNLSENECKEKIQESIKEFKQAKLIYYGEKMKVKLVEIKNE